MICSEFGLKKSGTSRVQVKWDNLFQRIRIMLAPSFQYITIYIVYPEKKLCPMVAMLVFFHESAWFGDR